MYELKVVKNRTRQFDAIRRKNPQLTDVEEETNGLLTYDRRVVKLDGHMVRQSLKAIRTAAGQTR